MIPFGNERNFGNKNRWKDGKRDYELLTSNESVYDIKVKFYSGESNNFYNKATQNLHFKFSITSVSLTI